MTHDFAKIRPEPLLERKQVDTPPAWSLMVTGMVLGLAIGVFACVLLYLSGNVPPLNNQPGPPPIAANEVAAVETRNEAIEEAPLQLEFYTELREYEVDVDAIPVDLSSQDPNRILETTYLLQAGAFERRMQAETEMQRQQALGLDVMVKEQALVGRTLYLVQSGPYTTVGELDSAEQVLRQNSISFFRIAEQ
ncbi:MAG: SPOR domain-containing protein [Gammaproteobacteria bacterium]